jgi:hypothetical protein
LSSSIWRCRLAAFSSCSCSRADVRSSCHKSQTRPSRKVCDSVRGGRVGSGGAARGDAATGLLRRADWCAGMCLRGQADGRKRAPRPTAEGHSRGTPRYSTGTDLILVLLALSGLGAQVQDKLSRQPWLRAPPALTRAHAVSTARVCPQPVHAWTA